MVRRINKMLLDNENSLRGFDDYQLCLGDILRGERATKGKSLLNVQREIKINAKYISAIENADLSIFESAGFIPGYVKSYALYLGIDPDWAFERFCLESGFELFDALSLTENELKNQDKKVELGSKNIELKQSLIKFGKLDHQLLDQVEFRAFGSIAVLVILIGALSFGGLSIFRQIQQVSFEPIDNEFIFGADLSDTISSRDNLPRIISEKKTNNKINKSKEFLDRPQILNQPIFESRNPTIVDFVKETISSEIKSEIESAILDMTNSDDNLESINKPRLRPIVQVTQRLSEEILIFSLKPAYIRVSESDGTILYSKILEPGEYFTVPRTPGLKSLRAGMSGHVYFRINGNEYGPVGDGPTVERNIEISSKSILKRYALADFSSNIKAKKIIADLDLNMNSQKIDLE